MEHERAESSAADRLKIQETDIIVEAIRNGFGTTLERLAQAQNHESRGEIGEALSILEGASKDYVDWLATNHGSYYGKFCSQLGSSQSAVAEREKNPEKKYSLYEKAVENFTLAKEAQLNVDPSNRFVRDEDCCFLLGDALVHCAERQKNFEKKLSLFEKAIDAYDEALGQNLELAKSNPDYYTDITLASAHAQFRIDKDYRNLIEEYNDALDVEGISPLQEAKIHFNFGDKLYQSKLYREKEIEQYMGEHFKNALHQDLEKSNPEMYGQALGYYGLFRSRSDSPQGAQEYLTLAMDEKYSLKNVNPRLFRDITKSLEEARGDEVLKKGGILKVVYQEDGTKAWEPTTNDDVTVPMRIEGYNSRRSIVIFRPVELHGRPPWKSLYKAQMRTSEPRDLEGTDRRTEGEEGERLKLGDLPRIGTVVELDKDDEGNARLKLWNPPAKDKEASPSIPSSQASESGADERWIRKKEGEEGSSRLRRLPAPTGELARQEAYSALPGKRKTDQTTTKGRKRGR